MDPIPGIELVASAMWLGLVLGAVFGAITRKGRG